MNSFICPTCGREHEVYNLHDTRDRHSLHYVCDGIQVQYTDRTGHVGLRSTKRELKYTGPELSGPFREVWTHRLAEEKKGRKQLQLLIMHEPKRP